MVTWYAQGSELHSLLGVNGLILFGRCTASDLRLCIGMIHDHHCFVEFVERKLWLTRSIVRQSCTLARSRPAELAHPVSSRCIYPGFSTESLTCRV